MTVQILDIVIYSHDGEKRVLSLKPGKVNIITGASQTGKSALSDIIDYCFGSSECHVAHGPLRLRVAWYGLRLQLEWRERRRLPPHRAPGIAPVVCAALATSTELHYLRPALAGVLSG